MVDLNEHTPLNRQLSESSSESVRLAGVIDYNEDDFFKVIREEMSKINNFFVGKLAELRILLDEITRFY